MVADSFSPTWLSHANENAAGKILTAFQAFLLLLHKRRFY
jgi:hypothetical protein